MKSILAHYLVKKFNRRQPQTSLEDRNRGPDLPVGEKLSHPFEDTPRHVQEEYQINLEER